MQVADTLIINAYVDTFKTTILLSKTYNNIRLNKL